MSNRKLRMGMIGGGKDAFIGAIHRIAANMDGQIELVCGALSMHEDVAIESGKMLFLPADRTYTSYKDMFEAESKLPADHAHGFCNHCYPQLCTLCTRYDGPRDMGLT